MSLEDSDVYQALLDGDLAALGCSLGQQDLTLRDASGKSYLHICIELGQTELVEHLAQRVFLGFRDDKGCTALDLASRYRMEEVERQLVRRVEGMRDSDDTSGLLQLFQAGWRVWPPLPPLKDPHDGPIPPGHRCQLNILDMQSRVDKIHRAVYQGQLDKLQEAMTDKTLVTACDHTGLPPLQKAVLFESFSIVQYLIRGFPHTVNHPDHMERTALHYAAAYYFEHLDDILYKKLTKAGAREDIQDLLGYRPQDYLHDGSLFSIKYMREEVKSRLSRNSKDYTNGLSWATIQSSPCQQIKPQGRGLRRWKNITSAASFAYNHHRKVYRCKALEQTALYECIMTNDILGARYVLEHASEAVDGESARAVDLAQQNVEGLSYLHLAVMHSVSAPLFSLLLAHISPAQRDCEGLNVLELALLRQGNKALVEVILNVILGDILRGDLVPLQGLAQDGWQYWPSQLYLDQYLPPALITPDMRHFLLTVDQFVNDVAELHKMAILHQEPDQYQNHLLNTDSAVTCLNNMGLSLTHLCVIFYNIKLLTRLLHNFPFVVNLKDSAGRTPLHYAAALDDDDYIYSLLRAAHASDEEEDLWGMRPCDYTTQKKHLLSQSIQEGIRNKLHHPLVLSPNWPTCLLSARMEGSKGYMAIKANAAEELQTLMADGEMDITQRDSEGRGFLHQAVLTAADPVLVKVLLDGGVDLATRDMQGKTAMDMVLTGHYLDVLRDVLEAPVKQLIFEAKEKEVLRLLMAGWSHWPVTADAAKLKSDAAAQLLKWLTHLQSKVRLIHQAVKDGKLVSLKDLQTRELSMAADPSGLLPLHKAVLYHHTDIVHFYITKFTHVLEAKDHMGRTALHYAAALQDNGHLYGLLKTAGADDTVKDLLTKTARDYKKCPNELPVESVLQWIEQSLKAQACISNDNKPIETQFKEITEKKANSVGLLPYRGVTTYSQTIDKKTEARKSKVTQPGKASTQPGILTPASLYITKKTNYHGPPPSTTDGKYLAERLGTALTLALAEIVEKRPSDPIEYLGQWLNNYR